MNKKGFTLVEIAIVLVIIGLLIGGILKGQQLIKQAKIKRLVKMSDEIRAAWNAFYDKYNMIPGDENNPTLPPGDTHNGNGNGYVTGRERYYVFEDLAKAGLISGDYNGSNLPKHPFGGDVDVYYATYNGKTAHWIRFFNVPADVCYQIDLKYDDGKYNSGSIQGSGDYSSGRGTYNLYIEL